MLRMDGFTFQSALSPEEAVERFGDDGEAMYVAGGTDLLPNLKHRIFQPKRLIGLSRALTRGLGQERGEWVIGAGTRLSALAREPVLGPLATAAGLVAGPQIRNMGTLGGNILLDTRCLFYNQTAFWRQALGHCLKAEGDWCHVVNGPKTCVASQSSDTVPVLLALDARIRLFGPAGHRELALRDLYRFNGMDHLALQKGELLTEVVVPAQPKGSRGSYQKLRTRGAIDFPQVGVAIIGRMEGESLAALEVVIGAVNPQPKPIAGLSDFFGRPLDEDTVQAIGERVHKRTRPQGSVAGDPTWRRQMARHFVERGLRALREGREPNPA